jgi:hypothetical protein
LRGKVAVFYNTAYKYGTTYPLVSAAHDVYSGSWSGGIWTLISVSVEEVCLITAYVLMVKVRKRIRLNPPGRALRES